MTKAVLQSQIRSQVLAGGCAAIDGAPLTGFANAIGSAVWDYGPGGAPGPAQAGNIQATIGIADWPGPVAIGTVPAGSTVDEVVIEVSQAFDTAQCEVGDAGAHARLIALGESDLATVESYSRCPNVLYAGDTPIKLYFWGSAPSTGSVRVIVYYS